MLGLDIVKNLSKPLALRLSTVVGFRSGTVVGPLREKSFCLGRDAKGFAFGVFFSLHPKFCGFDFQTKQILI
jgi:hypothetical protein